jgi:prepilin-type N-terminal cleavage/methylation domain-containing protein
MRNKKGFTLIEIMVSLVLVGLIAAISGTSVVTATRSYLFARENNAITQKAQLALGRLNREFIELSNIKDAKSTCVVYESPYGRRAVAKVDSAVYLFSDYANTTCPASSSGGDILIDGVQTFSIMYNPSSGFSLWTSGVNIIQDLFAVSIQIILARPDTGGTVSFFTTISPRNNNNSGGAALPTAANPPPEYSGKQCFVTTAAYGDADHPVVVVLRQFRDRFLLPTEPGMALVRYYYEVGPSLAAAIEGNPIACLFVRLLLTPVVGFAFLALAFPVLIPVLLLLSWGIARMILSRLAKGPFRWKPRLQGQRGAMLVTLIAAMVVFAALGAVMIGMFGSSALNQVAGNNSQRAYYLAESGFRYAASRYIAVDLGSEAANETARETLMESELHGKTFSLAPGDGAFRLDAYPYYYKVMEIPSSNQLRTKVPGGFPLDGSSYNNGSWVQVRKTDGSILYVQISDVSTHTNSGYNEVRFSTFSGGNWDSTIGVGSMVSPVSVPNRATLTVTDGDGDGLIDYIPFVASSGAAAFPARNGIFTVKVQGATDPRILSYRELDITNKRLKGIGDPNGLPLASLTLLDPGTLPMPANFIELTKFIRLESTGTVGQGSAAVNRKVTYFTPIGYARAQPQPKTQYHDKMLDLSKWQTGDHIGRIGTATPGTSYGSTMRVGSTQTTTTIPGGSCQKFREFQTGLNWSAAGLPIQQEWIRASNYLSYDLEVKIFYSLMSATADQAYGLTFRLDESGNALGFTFAKGVPGTTTGGCDNDGIPYDLLDNITGYTSYKPALVFWMKLYAKQETDPALEYTVHSVTPTKYDDPPPTGTGTYAIRTSKTFWRNGERVRFVNTGGSLPAGIVAGRDYFIRQVVTGGLTYLYLFDTLANALNTNEPYWTGLQDITAPGSGTTTIIVQDPSFIKLAHQVLTSGNEYYKIINMSVYLKTWATFLTRVIEAPSVSFVSGGGTAGREILNGEIVYQTSNNLAGGTVNAIYRVARNPIYRTAASADRNWAGGVAQGVLLLERIKDNPLSNPTTAPFVAGSKIFVGDHPGGTWAGTVSASEAFRARDNWIMFYVGDPTGSAPADTNPFNYYRGPILRGSVLWPPDNTEDTVINTDNFTLLRFSDYVNTTYCTSFFAKSNTGSAGDVLRFTSPDGTLFYSPKSGTVFPAGRAEFGLHAFGNDAMWTEFDDFALQFGPGYGISRKGFLLPIQQ